MATRRLAIILSVDVVGYSRMMNSGTRQLLSALNKIFRSIVNPAVEKGGGRIVKLLGDGALIEFQSAYQALICAVDIQEKIQVSPAPYEFSEPIWLRIGLHAGDIVVEDGDVFGEAVNIAARIQAEAEAGGILLSRSVAELAGGDLPFRLRNEGAHSFKNISRSIDTLSVDMSGKKKDSTRAKLAKSQEIRFCKTSDGVGLAWSSVGNGPSIVKAPNWISHLELDWRVPGMSNIFHSIAGQFELIRFDARGNGLSESDPENIRFENFVDDLETVFDAAKVERAPILAISQGCAIATAFAARAPERVSAIVMIGGFPVGRAKRKGNKNRQQAEALKAMMEAGWDDEYPSLRDMMASTMVPLASLEDRRRYADDMRQIISPENLGRYRDVIDYLDVTDILSKVKAPCLVLHNRGDRMQPIEQGRMLAAGLTDARFIAYDSNNHIPTENDPCWPLIERDILSFLNEHA